MIKSKYAYGVWNGKEVIATVILDVEIRGLSVLIPYIDSKSRIRATTFKMVYIQTRIDHCTFIVNFYISIKGRSKPQIKLILSYAQ